MRFILQQVGDSMDYILRTDYKELYHVEIIDKRNIEVREDGLLVYRLKHTSGRTNNLLILNKDNDWIGTVLRVKRFSIIRPFYTKVKMGSIDLELNHNRNSYGLVEYLATHGEEEVGKVYPSEKDRNGNTFNTIYVSEKKYLDLVMLAILYHTKVFVTQKGQIKTRWNLKAKQVLSGISATIKQEGID